MEFPKNKLEEILAGYKPEVRYLQKVELQDNNKLKGIFKFDNTFYVNDGQLEHFAVIEAQLCLHQIAYCYLAYRMQEENLPELSVLDLEIQRNNSFLISVYMEFNKQIPVDKEIVCELNLKREKIMKNLCIWIFDYNFNQGICKGEFKTALKLK